MVSKASVLWEANPKPEEMWFESGALGGDNKDCGLATNQPIGENIQTDKKCLEDKFLTKIDASFRDNGSDGYFFNFYQADGSHTEFDFKDDSTKTLILDQAKQPIAKVQLFADNS